MPQPNGDLTNRPSQAGSGVNGARLPRDTLRDQEQADAERLRREERTRRSEQRLQALIRDICSGCDYRNAPARRQNVVRTKG